MEGVVAQQLEGYGKHDHVVQYSPLFRIERSLDENNVTVSHQNRLL